MEEVDIYNIFPSVENLLQMERKHGDMITYQDMTGIYKEVKRAKKIDYSSLLSEDKSYSSRYSSSRNSININKENKNKEGNIIKIKNIAKTKRKIYISKSQGDLNKDKIQKKFDEEYQEKLKNIHKLILKQKTDSRNELYEKFLEEKKNKKNKLSKSQIFDNNIKYIQQLKQKIPKYKKFCMPCKPGEEMIKIPKEILFCPSKRNYYDALINKMREKYIKDTKHYYLYSNHSLALNFPMVDPGRNEEYINYLENKKKWINNQDFERYKQPEREKYYFPKIKNYL